MSEMPPLGGTLRGANVVRILVAVVIVVGAVTGGLWWKRATPPPVVVTLPPPPPPEPPPKPRRSPLEEAGLRRASITLNGPLETALVAQLGRPLGRALTQVAVRELVWWVEIPGEFRRNDRLDILFKERQGEEPVVEAIRFKSQKLGRTLRAYRWKAPGATWARFYEQTGEELELRLEDAPLDDYEQITSLLRDGRGHKGVDFKTPVGTPVKSPFDGVVQRKNWNQRMNGNSLEIKESGGGGHTVELLHLSELPKTTTVGAHVTRGQVVAASGNTGHSYAPHLHYQLMTSAQQVADPFADHHGKRLRLPDEQKAAFDAEAARLETLFDVPLAGS